MNTYFDNHFKREVVTIYPGEYYSTDGEEMISTVLGSCISVVLYDPHNNVGGINHYMLALDAGDDPDQHPLPGKFGVYAIDLLILDIVKKGGVRENLEAKVFGGGNIFNMDSGSGTQVGDANSRFAFNYLKKLKIPIVKSDTGGTLPRKIFFDKTTFKVFMKYIDNHKHDGANRKTVPGDEYLEKLTREELELSRKIELKTVKNLFANAENAKNEAATTHRYSV